MQIIMLLLCGHLLVAGMESEKKTWSLFICTGLYTKARAYFFDGGTLLAFVALFYGSL